MRSPMISSEETQFFKLQPLLSVAASSILVFFGASILVLPKCPDPKQESVVELGTWGKNSLDNMKVMLVAKGRRLGSVGRAILDSSIF
ncbi:Band 3 Anion Transport Protein [Manis pentadactyla]|nr:Band 3 Anion Transport Protein [Manis pentadactyla]